MELVKKAGKLFDRICDFLAFLAGALCIGIMFIVSTNVIMRFGLRSPVIWVIEVSEYALLFITFLGTAWLLREDGHVKIDLVINFLKPRHRIVVNVLTSIICAIICLVLTWYGSKVMWDSFQAGYLLPSSLRPPSFIIQSIIPVGGFLLLIQFVRRIYEYLGSWRTAQSEEQ